MNAKREKKIFSGKIIPWAIFAAALGGISPNLMNLAILLTNNGELPEYTYILGSLIFFLMGGAVGFVWQETNLKRAFCLGIGLPALIQVGIGDISHQQPQELPPADVMAPVSDGVSRSFSLTSPAMAQGEATESKNSPIYGRKVLLEIDRRFLTQTFTRSRFAVFYSHHGQERPRCVQIPILSTFINAQKRDGNQSNRVFMLQLDIPVAAKTFWIQVGKEYSRPATLSTKPNLASLYKLQYIPSKWSGFMRAFGKRSASKYRVGLNHSGPAPISFDSSAQFAERDKGYNWYQWKTYVEAKQAQLADIVEIEYKLHRSFKLHPRAKNRSEKFAISERGWGSFWIHAIVSHSKGKQRHIQYYLDLRKRDVPAG